MHDASFNKQKYYSTFWLTLALPIVQSAARAASGRHLAALRQVNRLRKLVARPLLHAYEMPIFTSDSPAIEELHAIKNCKWCIFFALKI